MIFRFELKVIKKDTDLMYAPSDNNLFNHQYKTSRFFECQDKRDYSVKKKKKISGLLLFIKKLFYDFKIEYYLYIRTVNFEFFQDHDIIILHIYSQSKRWKSLAQFLLNKNFILEDDKNLVINKENIKLILSPVLVKISNENNSRYGKLNKKSCQICSTQLFYEKLNVLCDQNC